MCVGGGGGGGDVSNQRPQVDPSGAFLNSLTSLQRVLQVREVLSRHGKLSKIPPGQDQDSRVVRPLNALVQRYHVAHVGAKS